MAKAKIIGHEWNLAAIWEESFRCLPDRPMQKRNYIYASELGGSYHDRYLKMNAHPFSNPYNFRSQGKMMAGKFFESVVKQILVATGIYQASQVRSEIELPGCIKVAGKLDFVAGGNIDWDEAKHRAEKMKELFALTFDDLSPFVNHMTDKILVHFQNLFTHVPLMKMILEVKSVSGFIFQLIKNGNKPRGGHPLQVLHYLLGNKDMERGLIPYINREDVMIQEFYITREKNLLKKYKEDVATMTHYYNEGAMGYMKHLPPKDPELIFEEASFKFVKNNKVEYSPYLTMSYGYKSIDNFKEKWDKSISSWNSAFRRFVLEGKPTGKLGNPLKLSDANKQTRDAAIKYFPDWDKYVAKAKAAGAFQKIEEEGEDE